MSLQGDLTTLELGDLFQNLETHQRTGILELEGSRGKRQLYFREGRLSLFADGKRPSLMEVLVSSGVVRAEDLEAAKKKRRRSRKSLGEVLIEEGAIEESQLLGIATARLMDEVCELIASEKGSFRFTKGKIPRGMFDPEERRLKLSFPAGPLLLEAARREDHWRLIREQVPSDAAHYVLDRAASPRSGAEPDPLREAVLERIDGTLSVSEVMAPFPHCRFEAYQRLAYLVETRVLRLATPDDMVQLAKDLLPGDPERAWQVIERGLEQTPRHLSLLVERAMIAEEQGQLDAAMEALKLLVHLNLESGDRGEALAYLERAKGIGSQDLSLWERSFEIALESGQVDQAAEDGRRLAELYRAPGLHRKAAGVFKRLTELVPDEWDFQRELAQSHAQAGEVELAVEVLERFAKKKLQKQEDELARSAYAEILSIDGSREEARERLEGLEDGLFRKRQEERRETLRRTLWAVGSLVLFLALFYDLAARRALGLTLRQISADNLIEDGQHGLALERLQALEARFPLASVRFFELGVMLEELERKAR